jgi:DNA replication protein DnaC
MRWGTKDRPILLTTNKALRQWGCVLHDEELARAILDRTLHYGEHIQFTGPSYRLKGRKLEWEDSTVAAKKEAADL